MSAHTKEMKEEEMLDGDKDIVASCLSSVVASKTEEAKVGEVKVPSSWEVFPSWCIKLDIVGGYL